MITGTPHRSSYWTSDKPCQWEGCPNTIGEDGWCAWTDDCGPRTMHGLCADHKLTVGTTAPAPAPAASVTDGVDPAMLAALIAALKTPSA